MQVTVVLKKPRAVNQRGGPGSMPIRGLVDRAAQLKDKCPVNTLKICNACQRLRYLHAPPLKVGQSVVRPFLREHKKRKQKNHFRLDDACAGRTKKKLGGRSHFFLGQNHEIISTTVDYFSHRVRHGMHPASIKAPDIWLCAMTGLE